MGATKISVREFAWHHLLTLYRYRQQVLPLDSALFLTHGSPLGAGSLLASLNPAREVEMCVNSSSNGDPALIGQMHYVAGERSARLSFLAPDTAVNGHTLPALIEYFTARAGAHGAYHLLADLDERHPAFEAMRRAGFSVYAWQRIWSLPMPRSAGGDLALWRPARSIDEIAIRSLYGSLTPPLVQAAEPLPERISRGLVYCHKGDVLAYVDGAYGTRGILLHPLIHPDAQNATELLGDLLHNLPTRLGRPVYITVRSYQAWLETSLQQLDGSFAPRQALLVRHLVTPARAAVVPRYGVLESPRPEAGVSIVHPIYNTSKQGDTPCSDMPARQ